MFWIATDIGVWCNGNTTDSGPVILGSSPSTPTEEIAKSLRIKHLAILLFYITLVSQTFEEFDEYLPDILYGLQFHTFAC